MGWATTTWSISLLVPPDGDLAVGAVDVAPELLGVEGVEVLAGGADHRLLEICNQQIAVDVAVAGDGVEDAKCFRIHVVELLSC